MEREVLAYHTHRSRLAVAVGNTAGRARRAGVAWEMLHWQKRYESGETKRTLSSPNMDREK